MPRENKAGADRRPSRFSRAELAVVATIVALVAGVLYFGDHGTHDAALGRACLSNLHGIRVALQIYQDQFGTLPPAYVCDRAGRPMHSWRVLILPQLGYREVYRRYRFDEPWNSRHNLRVADEMPDEYRCPADARDEQRQIDTSYLAVVGAGTVWPGQGVVRVAADDARIAVAEVANSHIAWSEPRDLTIDSFDKLEADAAPSLAAHHERRHRFASLGRLLVAESTSGKSDAEQLRRLATDGNTSAPLAAKTAQ